MQKPGAPDQLPQVHELNRAFLGMLQTRVRLHRPCLGLPAVAEAPLEAAAGPLLEAAAAFPRALFEVKATGGQPRHGETPPALDEAEHDVCFSILFAARQTSRQSAYQARLLFGLQIGDIEHLAVSGFAELRRLACTPGVVQCAFRERPWFWQSLFTATRPELRRQLTLMALQPCLTAGWPLRRPPQPAA
jgi:hypothetical protein